jgi:hypothetical protein
MAQLFTNILYVKTIGHLAVDTQRYVVLKGHSCHTGVLSAGQYDLPQYLHKKVSPCLHFAIFICTLLFFICTEFLPNWYLHRRWTDTYKLFFQQDLNFSLQFEHWNIFPSWTDIAFLSDLDFWSIFFFTTTGSGFITSWILISLYSQQGSI